MTTPPTPPAGGPHWYPNQMPPAGNGPSPQSSSNRRRWVVLGLASAMVVALVAGLLAWRAISDDSGTSGSTQPADNGVDRTVGLLRETDPVCEEWRKYADQLAEKEKEWPIGDDAIPATQWTAKRREIYAAVGQAMDNAANQFELILPKARNIVLQELIAQTIVYLRDFVSRIPAYTESDSLLAGVAGNFGTAISYMCSAVPLVPAHDEQGEPLSTVQDPASLKPFMASNDPVCDEYVSLIEHQASILRGWTASDPSIPASQWTPEQRRGYDAAREVLIKDLVEFNAVAEKARDRIIGDLLNTQIAYMRAFADVIPTYAPDDNQLWRVTIALGGGIAAACKASS